MGFRKKAKASYYRIFAFAILAAPCGIAAPGLTTQFGPEGLRAIEYNGATLMDTGTSAQDAFTIGEYRRIGPDGSVKAFWGENDVTRSWNAATSTLTWSYPWGSVKTRFQQSGDTLQILITVLNADKHSQLEGLNIYPFSLHFPQLPAGFISLNYPQVRFGTDGPGVITADYGTGVAALVNEDTKKRLYTGFNSTGTLRYQLLVGSTYNSGQPQSWPRSTRPVSAGGSDYYQVSLRFGLPGTTSEQLAADIYGQYRSQWPFRIRWTDRRPMGALFLSSSASGDIHKKAGFPTNPRRYFNDPKVDITSASGLEAFQQRILAAADFHIKTITSTGGQGMIAWDIEGQEYPQETSYLCDPEKLPQLAPEMETVLPQGSPFAGMRLVDVFFKKFKDAGLKTGVCIRPQELVLSPEGAATQTYLDQNLTDQDQIDKAVSAELIRKIGYAKARWGISTVYIDSSVNKNRGTLDAAVFRAVLQAFPDMLLIPEESTVAHLAYTSPWSQPSAGGYVRTPPEFKLAYPQAFSAIYVADAPQDKNTGNLQHYDQFVAGVRSGDVLIFRAFFDDSYFNGQVKKIYSDAAAASPAAALSGSMQQRQLLITVSTIILFSFATLWLSSMRNARLRSTTETR